MLRRNLVLTACPEFGDTETEPDWGPEFTVKTAEAELQLRAPALCNLRQYDPPRCVAPGRTASQRRV